MTRQLLTLTCLSVLSISMLAQNEYDVIRMAYDLPGGSARSTSLAGAIGAMGGDLGAAQTNPAGLGLYRTSEFVISPSMSFNGTSTDHYGTTTEESRSRFHLNNLGFLANYGEKEGTKWKGSSFGIVFDRIEGFHQDSRAKADGIGSSLSQQFLSNAQGVIPASLNPFAEGLAWDAFVLDTISGAPDDYVTTFSSSSTFNQNHLVSTQGSKSNTNIFFAANHDHRLFIGGSIGIGSMRFVRTIIHQEQTTDPNSDLQNFTYRDDLTVTGSGLNLKVGALYRIGESLRVGAAVHTPTGWSLNEVGVAELSSAFGNGDAFDAASNERTYSYRISTPWKYIASAAYTFGKRGLISVEFEHNDISRSRIKESSLELTGYDFAFENARVASRLNPIQSIRAGGEFRSGLMYFRAGYGIWPNAFVEEDVQHGNDLSMITGGIGYRKQRISLDLGISRTARSNNFFAYSNAFVDMSESTSNRTRAVLTLAFRP